VSIETTGVIGEQELAGRVAIVTGAGRGIGAAIAEEIGSRGAHVVVADLVASSAVSTAERLVSSGLSADAMELDVSSRASCQDAAAMVIGKHSRLDYLVNNAGIAGYGSVTTMAERDWRRHLDVILTGTFLMTQAAVPSMIEKRSGSIVNIASIGGLGGWPLRGAYNASKAGVINLTATLAGELGPVGVRVNSVSPGTIRTPMAEEAHQSGVASLDRYAARAPARRLGTTREIASVVAFLLSDRAAFITGVNLRVDGGWVAWLNSHGPGYQVSETGGEHE
jgi:NAD(P)-dependent dehydrogenase (short-subunit alcohol dehydrogenase family)